MLISKFITSQPGWQTIEIYKLPNTWRSKSNHTMKFVQLIEYNMGNIFVEKSYTKYGEEIVSLRPFSEKSKLNISLDK